LPHQRIDYIDVMEMHQNLQVSVENWIQGFLVMIAGQACPANTPNPTNAVFHLMDAQLTLSPQHKTAIMPVPWEVSNPLILIEFTNVS
jgi:hypothetical protein